MLNNYLEGHELPKEIPASEDEIGKLIKHIHSSIHTIDKLLQEKEEVGILLSHDLRMPLSQIMMLTQAMRNENVSPETAKYIKMINTVAQGQLEFIGEMLMLFKADKGISADTGLKKIDLFSLVENVLDGTKIAAFQKGLNVFNDIEENLQVYAQKDLLQHAVQNLVSNAIKFSHNQGSIYITSQRKNGIVEINVKDEGIGFNIEEHQKLFSLKPVRKEGTMGEKSNGMGLYFVKKIAEKHAGNVVAHSEGINRGATFSLTLPAQTLLTA